MSEFIKEKTESEVPAQTISEKAERVHDGIPADKTDVSPESAQIRDGALANGDILKESVPVRGTQTNKAELSQESARVGSGILTNADGIKQAQTDKADVSKVPEASQSGADKASARDRRGGKLSIKKNKKRNKYVRELDIKETTWYKLDNAALVFMPARSKVWTAVFRLSAVMKENVDPEILQEALIDILPRFPSFAVTIKSGVFWYYLETSRKIVEVEEDKHYPCQRMDIKSNSHLIRVLYHKNRIAFESFHAITDGSGGFLFLNTLIARYLERKGVRLSNYDGCLNYLDRPTADEVEDSYARAATGKNIRKLKEVKSYQIMLNNEDPGIFNVIHGTISATAFHTLAKKHDVSIGHFILAALFQSVINYRKSLPLKQRRKYARPIRVTASVDLRKRFKSTTLRNFSTYFNMQLDNDDMTFEELLQFVKNDFKRLDNDYLLQVINGMTTLENKLLVRILPLFLKNIGINIGYYLLGETLSCIALSNFGRLQIPPEFYEHIERFESMLGPQKINSIASSCLTYGDDLIMTFSSRAKETPIERDFFRILASFGLDITIDTNRRDCVV